MTVSLNRRQLLLTAAGISAASLSLPPVQSLAANAETVVSGRLGWPHSMPFIADELGLWKKHGLDVAHRDLGNGSAAAEAIASGSANYGYVGVPNAISLLKVGVPIKILSATTIGGTTVYTFDKSINSVAHLRGKKVGIPRGVTTHALLFQMYVAPKAGLDIKRDLTLIPLAPTDNITAMLRGDVDAAVSFDPYVSQALMHGARVLVPPEKMWDGPAFSALVVGRSDFAAKDPGTLRKLLAVHAEAIAFTNQKPSEAAKIVNSLLRGTQKDYEILELSLKHLTFTTRLDPVMLDKFAKAMVDFGIIKSAPDLAKAVDTSFLPKDAM